jgi:fused signal recognition particle receptor
MFRLFKKKKPTEKQPQDTDNTTEEQSLDANELETAEVVTESIHEEQLKKPQEEIQKAEIIPEITPQKIPETPQEKPKPKKESLFKRLRSGLSRTGSSITEGMGTLVLGKKKIDEDTLEDLETRLLMADVGMEATTRIIDDLTKRTSRNELSDTDSLMQAMQSEMVDILHPVSKPLDINNVSPAVILLVGINGAGKTTTIGKLAKKFQSEGKSVMLAAGDTFRAAAVEQLQVWGERNNIPVIAQGTGADSASVIYDAMESAKAKNIDVLLADTAGRLHTQTNLMEELKKVKRVMQKIDPNAPHETMLIVDASIGQNALAQATEFDKALGLTGITVTKLDGTAKGGILFAIAEKVGIPIRFIGVGESIDDLQEFNASEFVGALLTDNEE